MHPLFLWLNSVPPAVRLAAGAGTLLLLMVAECAIPQRPAQRRGRWLANFALLLSSGALLSIVPITAYGAAIWARSEGFGLLNLVSVPPLAALLASIVALDAAMYWEHRTLHGPAWLWRLHRVHHTDSACDATTALRVHPLEIALDAAWKSAAVVLVGAPPAAVIAFQIVSGTYAVFIHGNVRLGPRVDGVLRRGLVTPDLHCIHHSAHADDGGRNYGTILSCWDRWFGTFRAHPSVPAERMTIGLDERPAAREPSFRSLLAAPFARRAGPDDTGL